MNAGRQLLYRLYRLVSSVRHRVRRRLTPTGQAVFAGAMGAGALSLDTAASLSYQALILLLSLLGVGLVGVAFFRMRFGAARLLPRFGTVGVPLEYRVMLKNETGRLQEGLWLLENLADPRPGAREFVALQIAEERRHRSFRLRQPAARRSFVRARVSEAAVPPLAPWQQAEVRMELTPLRRGLVRFTGLTLARPDPIGLVRAYSRLGLPQSVLVLPRRYPVPPLALPGTMRYQQGGVALATSVGESEEYVSLRDYRQGDPLRHIHWRSWAKAGQPIVKEFQDEYFVRHALVLDTFIDHADSDQFEEAVSVAASFACAIQTQESLLDLLFVGAEAYCFTAGRGLAHTDQMLEILASVGVCRDKPFEALERLVLDHLAAVSGCVCVLLAWDERRQRFVRKLRQLGVPLLVLVIAGRGEGAALEPGPLREEPQRFRVLEVGAIAEGLAGL